MDETWTTNLAGQNTDFGGLPEHQHVQVDRNATIGRDPVLEAAELGAEQVRVQYYEGEAQRRDKQI